MEEKKFCSNCHTAVPTKIFPKNEKYEVLGEMVEVLSDVRICAICGEEIPDIDLDQKTISKAYAIYRKRHKTLSPTEIQNIRKQYGLSQRSFSKLLNWGDKTVFRY